MTPRKREGIEDAVALMLEADIPARKQCYGFTISHPDKSKFCSCGDDHDYRIHLRISTNKFPPLVNFCRFDFAEMAQFVINAYSQCQPNPSCEEILESMRSIDAKYDHQALETRVVEWCKQMTRETGIEYRSPYSEY